MSEVDRWTRALQTLFGLPAFRPHQVPIIEAVMGGHSALAIMATGGGKSLCFQFPASQFAGVTVVFSPLISLMTDQERALAETRVPAAAINSTLDPAEVRRRVARAAAGQMKILYVAPERLRSPQFVEAIQRIPVSLIAVDEAHCVSEWGHNFRPDYRRIALFRETVGNPPVLALTATAPPVVREDILRQLRLQDARTFVSTCNRPNLYLEVRRVRDDRERGQELVRAIRETPHGSIIVYVTRVADTAPLAQALAEAAGVVALPYHGQMEPSERRRVQEAFTSGAARVVVATNAFGMGIDKPDVRLVAHAGLPGSVEAYYQEVGRAGRDGLPARCILLYTPRDVDVRGFLIDQGRIHPDDVELVWRHVSQAPVGAEASVPFPDERSDPYGRQRSHLDAILVELEWQGAVERLGISPNGFRVRRLLVQSEPRMLRRVADHFLRRNVYDEKRFVTLQSYLTHTGCRREFILRYFSEESVRQEPCCDTCSRIQRVSMTRASQSKPTPAPSVDVPKYSRDLTHTHRAVSAGKLTWFIPLNEDPGAILFHNPADETGSGGEVFTFQGKQYRGLWTSNPASLEKALGIRLGSLQSAQPRSSRSDQS